MHGVIAAIAPAEKGFERRIRFTCERERLARIFDAGLGEVVGHVLPVARNPQGDGWQTGSWYSKKENWQKWAAMKN